MRKPPAVVIPADRPAALGIARSLGRRGIRVYGIDADPRAIGMVSRYVTARPLPSADDSDENRLESLVDLGKRIAEGAVLYPVRDDDVILCSRERQELQKYYSYVMPAHETIMNLLTKDGLFRTGRACNIPVAHTYLPNDLAHLQTLAAGFEFPVILKPVLSSSWLRSEIVALLRDSPLSNPSKVALCRNAAELLRRYQEIAPYDQRLVVQEVIPGEDERLAYFCFYLDRDSKPLATFAGRKLRILPVGFGSATYVRSFYDRALEEIGLRLLQGSQYQGLGGIEFNARFGMWDSLGARCGVDIPYVAYCDALGIPVEARPIYRQGVAWVDLQRDIRAFLICRRRGRLSLKSWLGSLRGEKEGAVYAADDWKPAVVAVTELLNRPWNVLKKRLSPAVVERR